MHLQRQGEVRWPFSMNRSSHCIPFLEPPLCLLRVSLIKILGGGIGRSAHGGGSSLGASRLTSSTLGYEETPAACLCTGAFRSGLAAVSEAQGSLPDALQQAEGAEGAIHGDKGQGSGEDCSHPDPLRRCPGRPWRSAEPRRWKRLFALKSGKGSPNSPKIDVPALSSVQQVAANWCIL